MPFTGKATFTAAPELPELMEDVSDIIGIVSPFETPLLDRLGDPARAATSTIHEWLEDDLLPNTDLVNQSSFTPNATDATAITVDHGDRFRPGDQVRPDGIREIMLVTAVAGNVLTVVRRYGGTTGGALADNKKLFILGNAALEGDDRPSTRFSSRNRRRNYTQIFTSSVEVSGSMQAVRTIGVADEVDYQKQERLRELLRDLENCVINGVAPGASPQGSATGRRTMNGIIPMIATNQFVPGSGSIPAGGGSGLNELDEEIINASLRAIWEQSSARIDTIVVGGAQKRRINALIGSSRRFQPSDVKFTDLVSVYESDFGVARILLSRWVPTDTMLLLDSSRIQVLPLSSRSFHYKPLAATGDSEVGQLIGEYTLELRNENAHGLIRGLAT
jgi:hypothetical protein